MPWSQFWTIVLQFIIALGIAFVASAVISAVVDGIRGKK